MVAAAVRALTHPDIDQYSQYRNFNSSGKFPGILVPETERSQVYRPRQSIIDCPIRFLYLLFSAVIVQMRLKSNVQLWQGEDAAVFITRGCVIGFWVDFLIGMCYI